MRLIGESALGLLLILVTGCAMHNELPADPKARIAVAKKATHAAEMKAVSLVPDLDVGRVEQLKTETFLRCSSGHQWSGEITAPLRLGIDGFDVQQALARAASEHGFTVTRGNSLTERPRYQLLDDDEVEPLVTVFDDATTINVDSASPCFSLPKDFRVPANIEGGS